MGSAEVCWWPNYQVLMARRIDGLNWKTYTFTQNVVAAGTNPATASPTDLIENGFSKVFEMDGAITLTPIFVNDFIITYSKI